jgi:glycosyl transferase, family 25
LNTYVINRSDRPQRYTDVREELKKQGLNAHRFEAVVGKRGYEGCRDSHLAVIDRCQRDIAFMVLEDDVVFLEDITPYLDDAIRQMPPNWDLLYLGASPKQPQERYSENLFRLKNAFTTHAIIYHSRVDGAIDYILRHRAEIKKIDVFYAQIIQEKFNVFVTYPMICSQKDYGGKSDTCSRVDVSSIVKNYNSFCK